MSRVPLAPVTVVETPEFLRAARRLFEEAERLALIDYVARHPTVGRVIQATGGVRKLRWALEGRGKRGGARVIYFFHNERLPLFLITAFAKNESVDLEQADRSTYRLLTAQLVRSFLGSGE